MKTDRLIGILSILMQRDDVTAPYLAELFEVSRRTVSRDIEDLCKAGIPIVTKQGFNGGISVAENYRLDRTLLTNEEMNDILAGLRSLNSVCGDNTYAAVMEKLSAGSSDFLSGDQSVLIDLSSWYKEDLTEKIQLIREAIADSRLIEFRYHSPKGESDRRIEPYYLVFRWASWYVWGRCLLREDYRLFKLNRAEDLTVTDVRFEKRSAPVPDLSDRKLFPETTRIKVLFDPECKWRICEEYGFHCFTEQPDGRLLFVTDHVNLDHFLGWIMTFIDKAEILEPLWLRREMEERMSRALKKYGKETSVMIQSKCGLKCSECKYREEMGCQGCLQTERQFWGECPVKKCCNEKSLPHCGKCGDLPCALLTSFAYDEKQGDNGQRIENLKNDTDQEKN